MAIRESAYKGMFERMDGAPFVLRHNDTPLSLTSVEQSNAVTGPETPYALDQQVRSMASGRRKAVLVTPNSAMPEVPRGLTKTQTPRGVFIHNPRLVSSDQIHDSVAADDYGDLLGYVEPKSEKTTVGVVARDHAGRDIILAYASPENASMQAEEFGRQFPGARIEVGGREQEERIKRDNLPEVQKPDRLRQMFDEMDRRKTFDVGRGVSVTVKPPEGVRVEMSTEDNSGFWPQQRTVEPSDSFDSMFQNMDAKHSDAISSMFDKMDSKKPAVVFNETADFSDETGPVRDYRPLALGDEDPSLAERISPGALKGSVASRCCLLVTPRIGIND